MFTRRQTSSEGPLYELVARGVKDTYFLKDDKDSINPFDWRYEKYPSTLPEIRTTWPNNQPRFGQRCEWDFDFVGDCLTEVTLVIELPTWLPPEFVSNNFASDTSDSETGQTYGYVNGIAYFLFERIQIFQDTVLLQEVSGDSLYATSLTKSSWNQGFLQDRLAGVHDGSRISIQQNATPGELELRIPFPGCFLPGDKGFPICAVRGQTFRLRVQLRNLEDLVETSGAGSQKPAPWSRSFTQQTATSLVANVPAIERDLLGQPIIKLRTKQHYLSNEARQEFAQDRVEIPYILYSDNDFQINQLEYTPLDKLGGIAQITRQLDAVYTVERIVTYFRNSTSFESNKLWNFVPWFSSLSFYIAGQLREGPWDSLVYLDTTTDAKEERTPGRTLSIFHWGRGWRYEDQAPGIREPTGGINFTTVDRPILNITLTDIPVNPCRGYKQGFFTSCCESWALYVVEKGRGRLMFQN